MSPQVYHRRGPTAAQTDDQQSRGPARRPDATGPAATHIHETMEGA